MVIDGLGWRECSDAPDVGMGVMVEAHWLSVCNVLHGANGTAVDELLELREQGSKYGPQATIIVHDATLRFTGE